jgi:hypothetical protein
MTKNYCFMDRIGKETNLQPTQDVSGSAGYSNLSAIYDTNLTAETAQKYLKDLLLLDQLTERVYKLLQEDLRHQGERVNNYAPQRWL